MSFSKYFNQAVILHLPTNSAGLPAGDFPAMAIVLTATELPLTAAAARRPTVFLLKSQAEPRPGAQIRCREQTYDLQSVRNCRSLTGKIQLYRCVSY